MLKNSDENEVKDTQAESEDDATLKGDTSDWESITSTTSSATISRKSSVNREPTGEIYKVKFKPLSSSDLETLKKEEVFKIITKSLGVNPATALKLLYSCSWKSDNLIDLYNEYWIKTFENAGIPFKKDGAIMDHGIKIINEPIEAKFLCFICLYDNGFESVSLPCNHKVCKFCYQNYIKEQIENMNSSETILPIKCPKSNCNLVISMNDIKQLIPSYYFEKYFDYSFKLFIKSLKNIRLCPFNDCTNAIEYKITNESGGILKNQIPSVKCLNDHEFCFSCGLKEHHDPIPCEQIKQWIRACDNSGIDEGYINEFIFENKKLMDMKECPRCHLSIEKIDRSDHMVCDSCDHQFCWYCLAPSPCNHHICNKPDPIDNIDYEEFIFCYKCFKKHELSYDRLIRLLDCIITKRGVFKINIIDIFPKLKDILKKSRQTLKWSYTFRFYLSRSKNISKNKDFFLIKFKFQKLQFKLEKSINNLENIFLKPGLKLKISKIKINKSLKNVENRREELIIFIQQKIERFTSASFQKKRN